MADNNCRCVICDCAALARRGEVEPAIATACMVVLCQVTLRASEYPLGRLDTLKSSLCEEHRRGWALLLLRGGMGLDSVGNVEFSGLPQAAEGGRDG